MTAKVNADLCVGCGLCVDICPEVFVMEEDKAKVIASPVPSDAEENCKKSQTDCPVEAIIVEE